MRSLLVLAVLAALSIGTNAQGVLFTGSVCNSETSNPGYNFDVVEVYCMCDIADLSAYQFWFHHKTSTDIHKRNLTGGCIEGEFRVYWMGNAGNTGSSGAYANYKATGLANLNLTQPGYNYSPGTHVFATFNPPASTLFNYNRIELHGPGGFSMGYGDSTANKAIHNNGYVFLQECPVDAVGNLPNKPSVRFNCRGNDGVTWEPCSLQTDPGLNCVHGGLGGNSDTGAQGPPILSYKAVTFDPVCQLQCSEDGVLDNGDPPVYNCTEAAIANVNVPDFGSVGPGSPLEDLFGDLAGLLPGGFDLFNPAGPTAPIAPTCGVASDGFTPQSSLSNPTAGGGIEINCCVTDLANNAMCCPICYKPNPTDFCGPLSSE